MSSFPQVAVSIKKKRGFAPCFDACIDNHELKLALDDHYDGRALKLAVFATVSLSLVTKCSLVLPAASDQQQGHVALSFADRDDVLLRSLTPSVSAAALHELLAAATARATNRDRSVTLSLDHVTTLGRDASGPFVHVLRAYLYKLGSAGWKRYFFTCTANTLVYYADEAACQQGLGLGFLDLSQLSLVMTTGHGVEVGEEGRTVSTFRLQISRSREWFLGSEDPSDCVVWLQRLTSTYKLRTPAAGAATEGGGRRKPGEVLCESLACWESDRPAAPKRSPTAESKRLAQTLLMMLDTVDDEGGASGEVAAQQPALPQGRPRAATSEEVEAQMHALDATIFDDVETVAMAVQDAVQQAHRNLPPGTTDAAIVAKLHKAVGATLRVSDRRRPSFPPMAPPASTVMVAANAVRSAPPSTAPPVKQTSPRGKK